MKKKYIIIAVTSLFLLIMQFTPGCMMIGFHDEFDYQRSQKQAVGEFLPDLYIEYNTLKVPLIIFRIDIDKLPHSFVMLQYDQTYLDTDKGFDSFVLDELYLEFKDGTRVDCINPDLPIEKRTFLISNKEKWDYKKQVFDGVITKRMDFTVHTVGTAIKTTGEKVPFRRTTKYKFDKDATFHTILDEWAAC